MRSRCHVRHGALDASVHQDELRSRRRALLERRAMPGRLLQWIGLHDAGGDVQRPGRDGLRRQLREHANRPRALWRMRPTSARRNDLCRGQPIVRSDERVALQRKLRRRERRSEQLRRLQQDVSEHVHLQRAGGPSRVLQEHHRDDGGIVQRRLRHEGTLYAWRPPLHDVERAGRRELSLRRGRVSTRSGDQLVPRLYVRPVDVVAEA